MKLQIKEMLEYFTLDAIFYDQLFGSAICHCEHCKKRYLSEMGEEIPERANTQEWQESSRARERWLGEFAASRKRLGSHSPFEARQAHLSGAK